VVADGSSGAHAPLEGQLCTTGIPSVLALHSNQGVWQFVADEANPPAFKPRVVRRDRQGTELVH
jgi:hypothetical protein